MEQDRGPSIPKYVLEVTKLSLSFLADVADNLPAGAAPTKSAIAAVQRVIALVEVRGFTLLCVFDRRSQSTCVRR